MAATKFDGQKQDWRFAWADLVMDKQARHYQKMKNTIWLFLYLLLNANSKSGFLISKTKTISSETGIKKDTILRWLGILRKQEYIATRNTGRGLLIQIRTEQRPSSAVGKNPQQKQEISNSCYWKNPAAGRGLKGLNAFDLSRKSVFKAEPIDISFNKNILNIDRKNSRDPLLRVVNQTKPIELAMDIAAALQDKENLALYVSYCRRYPPLLLRTVLDKVRKMPSDKIKKSRGALFNYLVQKYAKETS